MSERPCDICKRPLWDGGHAISPRECTNPGDFVCQLQRDLTEAREALENVRREIRLAVVTRVCGMVTPLNREHAIKALRIIDAATGKETQL